MSKLRPRDLCDLLRVPFTTEQLRAATAPMEPAVIVAGAGSGKTAVMAARVVWLVVTGQVSPAAVLGLTFTNKAAAELSSRIRGALAAAAVAPAGRRLRGDAARPREGGETGGQDDGEPVVSTYHAYAARLISDHGLRIGVEPQSRLLPEAQRFQLATRVLRGHRGRIEALTGSVDAVAAALVELEAELNEHLVEPAIRRAVAWRPRSRGGLRPATRREASRGPAGSGGPARDGEPATRTDRSGGPVPGREARARPGGFR